MGIIDLFRPKWRHSDPKTRVAAVRDLADQDTLRYILNTDLSEEVRTAALRRICYLFASSELSPMTLKPVIRALGDADSEVRKSAIKIIEGWGDCCVNGGETVPTWLKELPDALLDEFATGMAEVVSSWFHWRQQNSWGAYFIESKSCSELRCNAVLSYLLRLLIAERDINYVCACLSIEIHNYGSVTIPEEVYSKSYGPSYFCATSDYVGSSYGEIEWGEHVTGGDYFCEVEREYCTLDVPAPCTAQLSREQAVETYKRITAGSGS